MQWRSSLVLAINVLYEVKVDGPRRNKKINSGASTEGNYIGMGFAVTTPISQIEAYSDYTHCKQVEHFTSTLAAFSVSKSNENASLERSSFRILCLT